MKVSKDLEVSGGYVYTSATVLSFSANPALVGLDIPQVPRQQFTLEGRYWNPRYLLFTLQGRFIGSQFDDDQNQLPLGRFFTMNLRLPGLSATGWKYLLQPKISWIRIT